MCDECRHGPYDHHHHHDHPHHHDRDRGPDRDRAECHCDCGCHDEDFEEEHEEGQDPTDFGFERQFISKAEMLEALQWYLKELTNEAQGVREAIAELKTEIAQLEADEAEAEAEAEAEEKAAAKAEAAPKKSGNGRKPRAKKAE